MQDTADSLFNQAGTELGKAFSTESYNASKQALYSGLGGEALAGASQSLLAQAGEGFSNAFSENPNLTQALNDLGKAWEDDAKAKERQAGAESERAAKDKAATDWLGNTVAGLSTTNIGLTQTIGGLAEETDKNTKAVTDSTSPAAKAEESAAKDKTTKELKEPDISKTLRDNAREAAAERKKEAERQERMTMNINMRDEDCGERRARLSIFKKTEKQFTEWNCDARLVGEGS
jgi:hypothetical protein